MTPADVISAKMRLYGPGRDETLRHAREGLKVALNLADEITLGSPSEAADIEALRIQLTAVERYAARLVAMQTS